MQKLKLYYIKDEYIDYLRKYDTRVFYNKKGTRPYVGVVYMYNDFCYFAPLASPKPKHLIINPKALDIFKIKDGTLGIVNINNILLTPFSCLTEIIPTINDKTYKILLEKQLTYLNNHKKELFKKVKIFYNKYQKSVFT